VDHVHLIIFKKDSVCPTKPIKDHVKI